jgi:6-phospho-beta-glucosidase
MTGLKIVVVGGASTYTPELVSGLAERQDTLPVADLVLLDPDLDRLGVVAAFAGRILHHRGWPGRLTATADRESALDGADAVLVQLRVGGQRARLHDETVPLASGCLGQETTGAGGLGKALRTVPVMLDLAEEVRRRAARDAWIISFTNPVGIVTRALRDAGHRAVGLCNVAIGFQRRFARMLDVAPEAVALGHVGLNHLTWERSVTVTRDGGSEDVLPRLLATRLPELAEEVELPAALLELQEAVPSYYLRYFYAHDEVLVQQRGSRTRAEAVLDVERRLLEQYADPSVDTKPAELSERGGAFYSEAAVDLMASLTTDRGDTQVVNVVNAGTLPFLPDDHVIEVPAVVSATGLTPVPVAPLAPEMAGLVAHVAEYERLALDAATLGGRDRVLRALLAHPLVGQFAKAERLTDLLLAQNARHLAWAR